MKIAIAGYGIEGQENYRYWSQSPENEVTIVDEKGTGAPIPEGVSSIVGPDAFKQLQDFDLVIRTAGLAPNKIVTNGKIWSATNEFFAKSPAPIVGVTGTKGKGTTASIVASLFKASGRTTWLVGNIGIAALEVLPQIKPEDIVIFELSSFQLWDIERSPQAAIVLLIEPDHLNVHYSMEDYVHAKGGITRYQNDDDLVVYHPTNADSQRIADEGHASLKLRYAAQDGGGVYVADGAFRTSNGIICSVDALQLRGDHNKDNACAAITVALEYGLSNEDIEQGLRSFEGLPHRIEFVRTFDGVGYYNDSFSSAPAATVAAIRSFDAPEILIVGGVDKGADFDLLAQEIATSTNLKEVILIGEIRHKLYEILSQAAPPITFTIFDGTTMPEIVQYAKNQAVSGDVVLLSPACASFDMFKDFYDRGTQFRDQVNNL